jgi:hypothetical protein
MTQRQRANNDDPTTGTAPSVGPFHLLAMAGERLFDFGELEPGDASAFWAALNELIEFEWARYHVAIPERNFQEFQDVMRAATAFDPGSGSPRIASREIGVEANRTLQNYLASARFFLQATETRLARTYGNPSPVFDAFKKATSEAYDSSFAYRFIYRFRNYAQHLKVPIGNVLVYRALGPDRREWNYGLTLALNVNELLSEGRDFWTTVYEDLCEAGPELDLRPLVETFHHHLRTINESTEMAQRPHLNAAAQVIETIGQPAISSGGMPVLGTLTHRSGKEVNYQVTQIPTDALRWLGCDWVVDTLD